MRKAEWKERAWGDNTRRGCAEGGAAWRRGQRKSKGMISVRSRLLDDGRRAGDWTHLPAGSFRTKPQKRGKLVLL